MARNATRSRLPRAARAVNLAGLSALVGLFLLGSAFTDACMYPTLTSVVGGILLGLAPSALQAPTYSPLAVPLGILVR